MATIEYVALLVVVSLALAVGGAVADAPVLPDAVAGQLRRAYCLVANGDCSGPGGPQPCVVSSRSRSGQTSVSMLVVRLRDGRLVLRELLSDGTVRVTVGANGGVSLGARLGMRIAGRGVDIDASAGIDIGTERSFVVPDTATAERLIKHLDDDAPAVGAVARDVVDFATGAPGDEDARALTVTTQAQAAAALNALDIGPELTALAGLTTGIRLDRRTRRRTVLLRLPRELTAELSSPIASIDAGLRWQAGAELVFDPQGRAEALVLRGRGAADAGKGVRIESDMRLDLTDPEAQRLLGRLTHGDLGAASALGDRLAEQARIDVRRYTTDSDSKKKGGDFLGVGAERVEVEERATLVSAYGRDPGGRWGENLDCTRGA